MPKAILFLILMTAALCIHFDHQAQSFNMAAFRNAELTKHNTYRAKHGSPSLKINETLNTIAQKYAEKLAASHVFEHSEEARAGNYGENLYWGWGSPSFNYVLGKASDSWYAEIAYYDYNTAKSTTSGKAVGHFTAMIWKSVSTVGFGYASVPEKNGIAVYVVANYSPTPNVIGDYQQNVLRPK